MHHSRDTISRVYVGDTLAVNLFWRILPVPRQVLPLKPDPFCCAMVAIVGERI